MLPQYKLINVQRVLDLAMRVILYLYL